MNRCCFIPFINGNFASRYFSLQDRENEVVVVPDIDDEISIQVSTSAFTSSTRLTERRRNTHRKSYLMKRNHKNFIIKDADENISENTKRTISGGSSDSSSRNSIGSNNNNTRFTEQSSLFACSMIPPTLSSASSISNDKIMNEMKYVTITSRPPRTTTTGGGNGNNDDHQYHQDYRSIMESPSYITDGDSCSSKSDTSLFDDLEYSDDDDDDAESNFELIPLERTWIDSRIVYEV